LVVLNTLIRDYYSTSAQDISLMPVLSYKASFK